MEMTVLDKFEPDKRTDEHRIALLELLLEPNIFYESNLNICRPRKYNKRGRKPGYRSATTKDDNAICEVCYFQLLLTFHFK